MDRTIKFRGLQKSGEIKFIYGDLLQWKSRGLTAIVPQEGDQWKNPFDFEVYPETVVQFTGLLDKNGKEVFEGDVIRYFVPYRTTQTHTGDNIPNGSYTEPMEPAIKEIGGTIVFRYGTFTLDTNDTTDFIDWVPISFFIRDWTEQDIKDSIHIGRHDIWDSPDEGDLQYLLEEYSLSNLEELIQKLNGVEVIGTIHDPK